MNKYIIYAVIILSMTGAGCATTGDVERVEQKVSYASSELSGIRMSIEEQGSAARTENRQSVERMEKLASDIDEMKQELALIKRNQASLGSAIDTMAGGELMDFTGRMDELRHEVETSKLKLDAFKAALLQKLSDIEEMLAAAGEGTGRDAAGSGPDDGQEAGALEGRSIPAGTRGGLSGAEAAAPAGAPPVADPLQMYQASYLDYTKGNYELALMGFKDYLASFPDGEFAGNAQYWVGESLYSLGHYSEALVEFEKVLGEFPDSPKASGALLKEGFCFDAIGRQAEAKAAYERVIELYPSSEAARLAADRLMPKTRGQVPGR